MPRVQLVRPHAAQQQILDEARRWNVVALGRRSGKSTLAQHLLAETALHAQPAGYFAPTYKLLAEFWREIRSTLEPITTTKSEQDHRLELITGGTLEMWSLDDPNPARGRKYKRIVVDEAAMVQNLVDIWQLALRPTLSDLQGSAWFMSTPQGLNGFHMLYLLGVDPLQPEWKCWQMPTSVNPYIPPEEIESARHELPERAYAQEYLAQFLALEGVGVFRGVEAVSRLQPKEPVRGHQYVFGVDWGRTNDFTAISILDATLAEQVALDRFSDIDFEYQSERLHMWADLYHPLQIVAEQNAMGRPLVERLQTGYARLVGKARASLPVYAWNATNASKAAAIQALALAIERGEVTLLADKVQMAELMAFESSVTVTGMVRYSAPLGLHDDTVTALSLSWLGCQQASASQPRTQYRFAARR